MTPLQSPIVEKLTCAEEVTIFLKGKYHNILWSDEGNTVQTTEHCEAWWHKHNTSRHHVDLCQRGDTLQMCVSTRQPPQTHK